jgi:hypothetical protein
VCFDGAIDSFADRCSVVLVSSDRLLVQPKSAAANKKSRDRKKKRKLGENKTEAKTDGSKAAPVVTGPGTSYKRKTQHNE